LLEHADVGVLKMTQHAEITRQLSSIVLEADLVPRSEEFVEAWVAASVGVEAVEPILVFMESHPRWDFGSPGPLVHFVERFFGRGYEERLVESISRKPTWLTTWMLNRVINREKNPEKARGLVRALVEAKGNERIDQQTLDQIERFLALHESINE
jgi:hypothetical protein